MWKYFCCFCFIPLWCVAESPFQLNTWQEARLSASGAAIGGISLFMDARLQPLTESQILKLDAGAIHAIDRFAVRCHNKRAEQWSDVLLLSCAALPALTVFDPDMQQDAGILALMYVETAVLAGGVTNLTKVLCKRTRPFVYNPEIAMHQKLNPDARKSFFSGHTSLAFTSAVYTASVATRYVDHARLDAWIWGGCLTLASSVAVCRVWGGQHFLTDVLGGALAGGLIGYAVPELHRNTRTQSGGIAPCLRVSWRW